MNPEDIKTMGFIHYKNADTAMKLIKDNAYRIKEIPPERILTEFDKIVKKGDNLIGAELLEETGLLKNIVGSDIKINRNLNWVNAKTMGEFIYLLFNSNINNISEFYKNNLKGDIETYKEIKALEFAFSDLTNEPVKNRSIAHNIFSISPKVLKSNLIPNELKVASSELLSGKYPKGIGDLAVNGSDLMQLGLKGKEIGDMLKNMLIKVYANKVDNNKTNLLNLINNKPISLSESKKISK